jgi:hypothetical protein
MPDIALMGSELFGERKNNIAITEDWYFVISLHT